MPDSQPPDAVPGDEGVPANPERPEYEPPQIVWEEPFVPFAGSTPNPYDFGNPNCNQ